MSSRANPTPDSSRAAVRRRSLSPTVPRRARPGHSFPGAPRRRAARKRALGVALVVVVAVALALVRQSSPGAPGASAATGSPVFYLAVGASASLGFQPTGILHHNGHRTNTGYANDVMAIEGFRGVTMSLRQVGCPGETVQSILSTTVADHCYQLPATQLTTATAYLVAHRGHPGLVTVDLGFNDVRLCLVPAVVNGACVAAGVAAVAADLPKVLIDLKRAAGPDVHFVGVEYEDPYLSHFLAGPAGPANATASLVAMDNLDTVLGHVYAAAHVPVANVPGLFDMNVATRVPLDNVGLIPENVARACALTWDCYGPPFGPDDHPNGAGYATIAQAIAAVLPARW